MSDINKNNHMIPSSVSIRSFAEKYNKIKIRNYSCEPNRPNHPSLLEKPLNLLLYIGEKVFFSTLWLPAQGTGTICSCVAVCSEERPNGLEEM